MSVAYIGKVRTAIVKLSPINKDDLKVGDVVGVAREVRCGWVAHETGRTDREYIDKFDLEHYEVVGNIFDNPELLQEECK